MDLSLVSIQFPIPTFLVVHNIFDTEQLQIGNCRGRDKTKLSCLVTSSVHTADTVQVGLQVVEFDVA